MSDLPPTIFKYYSPTLKTLENLSNVRESRTFINMKFWFALFLFIIFVIAADSSRRSCRRKTRPRKKTKTKAEIAKIRADREKLINEYIDRPHELVYTDPDKEKDDS